MFSVFLSHRLKSTRLTKTSHYCSYCILDSTVDSSGLCFCAELVKGTSEKRTTGENSCSYMLGEWTRKKGSGLSEPLQTVWPAQTGVQWRQRRESNTLPTNPLRVLSAPCHPPLNSARWLFWFPNMAFVLTRTMSIFNSSF